jgi:membrane-bound ClpP family serine protease
MDLHRVSWIVWIIGTALIILSWIHVVSGTIGWVGFVLALVGVVLSFIARGR